MNRKIRKGIEVMKEMLDLIGNEEGKGDHDLAKLLCDNELELRAMVDSLEAVDAALA